MTVGGAFVYVCERDRVKDFLYITRSVIMELQCTFLQIVGVFVRKENLMIIN